MAWGVQLAAFVIADRVPACVTSCSPLAVALSQHAQLVQVRVWDEGKAEWRMTPVTLHSLRRTYAGDTVGVKAVRV